ncbi:SDR family oxidoreductase [Alsobacter sp. KACC 23698]|uniref:SDR family oxidoreductase n=1 Tax=Alsobacter sp. KACC 23698 TaxID=3149229 RepID=A0AAU7JA13_9HYPH
MGVVVIVGGTGGIGQAVAQRLADAGRPVHLIARHEGRLAEAAARLGAGFTAADVEEHGAIAAAIQDAAARHGGAIAGLCYAVGTITLKPIGRLTDADFERDFRVNALGAARAVQAALPGFKAFDGVASVLFFSTVAVAQGFAAHASVAMAKGAVEGLTLSLAAELAPRVRVNAIAPSLTRTPLAAPLTASAPMAEAIAQLHAAQRLGDPVDIAPLAALLLSDEASWITGQIIGVDGGRSSLRTKG